MNKLLNVISTIQKSATQCHRDPNSIRLLAVTKNQPITSIQSLLDDGHRLFGENRVQEAYQKWEPLKQKFSNVELHLIGHLQTNKVKDAVALFDVIQTLDNLKLAEKLSLEEMKQGKKLRYLIELNIGKESQKTGVWPENFATFYEALKTNYPLNVTGIMCIPPQNENPSPYFHQMEAIADKFNLSDLSMGMSDDYELAIQCGSNMIRIGRALF